MDHRGDNDWFDEYIIMQMCEDSEGNSDRPQSTGGGRFPMWIWVIIIFAILKLIFS